MSPPLTGEQVDQLAHKLRSVRDALLTITNAGPDMPAAAMKSVAWLTAKLVDELLAEIAP